MDKEAQKKIAKIDDYLLNQAMAIWRAGNCIKYKPDEVPIESLRDIIKRGKEFLDSQGVVIKVDRELPDTIPEFCIVNLVEGRGYPRCLAGYEAVESLIEEDNVS